MFTLIVDHSEKFRETIKSYLNEICIEQIDEAETGISAINRIKRLPKVNKYDAIIIDVDMPRKDGLHILRDLTILSPNSKFIVCSSNSDIRTVVIARGFGVNEYIVKPFTRERFLRTFLSV
ncbi:Chemotaxis protein CheY [Sporomusa rhizae]|uniref:response regulator n=1 Tax=Sporomusa rhizae TaxID=357999 RepID=UPI00352A394E